jgi:hypothetical protein
LSSTPFGERESPESIATILDAKRGQFFIAVYKRLHENTVSFLRNLSSTPIGEQESTSHYPLSAIRYPLIKVLPDSLMTASQFLAQFACGENPIWLLGDGLLYYKDKFKADSTRFLEQKYWSPRASKVHLQSRQHSIFRTEILEPASFKGPPARLEKSPDQTVRGPLNANS